MHPCSVYLPLSSSMHAKSLTKIGSPMNLPTYLPTSNLPAPIPPVNEHTKYIYIQATYLPNQDPNPKIQD